MLLWVRFSELSRTPFTLRILCKENYRHERENLGSNFISMEDRVLVTPSLTRMSLSLKNLLSRLRLISCSLNSKTPVNSDLQEHVWTGRAHMFGN